MAGSAPSPVDLYLDLLARALTRDLFLDEEVRNVDLRDWPGGEPDGLREQFEAEYKALLSEAYPARPYGTVLPFRRIFVVAHRPADRS